MITEEQFRRLNALPPEIRAAAMSQYEKATSEAGAIPPDVQKRLMAEAIQMAENAESVESSRMDAELDIAAPPETFTLAGYQARPMSAGVVQVLERINHPIIVGGDVTLADIVAILYCLCWPSVGDIIRQAKDGTLTDAANEWAFEIDVSAINEAYAVIDESFAQLGTRPEPEKKTRRKRG